MSLFLFLFKSKYRRKRGDDGGGDLPQQTLLIAVIFISIFVRPASNTTVSEVAGVGGSGGCERGCYNGDCRARAEGEEPRCVCWEGWTGPRCDLCGGKVKLTEGGGRRWLAEAIGNYTTNMKCTWYVEADTPNATIRLHLKEFATECGWDHLYIWDGDSIFEGLQAVYSGLVRLDRYSTSRVPEVVGTSGSMLLHFYSDVAYNMTGFNITFSMDSCPSEYSATTCSGHGICEGGVCSCDTDYRGAACQIPACPHNCGRNGKCNEEGKFCECAPGWKGDDCSQKAETGYWEVAAAGAGDGGLAGGDERRTSHQSVVDRGYMWVVGGEQLHRQAGRGMLRRWDLARAAWHPLEVDTAGGRAPSERYGHSAVVHDSKIYMYGGVMRSGHVSKELWSFNLDTLGWEMETVNRGRCHSELCGEIHCAGHTATVVQNRMIVIFGHSPKLGFFDTVQEYHFGSREWNIIETSGYPVKGGYGHSAVLDELTNKIYVYGGYVSTSSSAAQLTSSLYSFDHLAARWELRTASSSYRYLHSAVLNSGLMLVFGGNTHNDTQFSQGAKCYSSDFIAYDIACDRWYSLEHTIPRDFSGDLPRYGHSAVFHNGTVYIYGGFNGQTKSDILTYTPGQCAHMKDDVECMSSRTGVKCVWNKRKESCDTFSAEVKKNSLEMCEPPSSSQQRSSGSGSRAEWCSLQASCHACLATALECVWCGNSCHEARCPQKEGGEGGAKAAVVSRLLECPGSGVCENLHTCDSCMAISRCKWNNEKQCREKSVSPGTNDSEEGSGRKETVGTCPVSCSERRTCANCTAGFCMWCHNQEMCVDRNAYLASFPYGQCMDWTTHVDQCPGEEAAGTNTTATTTTTPNLCNGYSTCSECLSNPACGWCDEGSLTGLGRCHEGGARGPLQRRKSKNQWVWEASSQCRDQGGAWHFTSCPLCQCNGHANCTAGGPAVCDQPCQHNTQGEHCERCTDGFFGKPVNGGECRKCECNGQGSLCDHRTGNCYCNTKGVTGDHCEKCDTQNHYFGDPIKESCFYDLAIDYQFTFNLSKPEDKHYTSINFKNVPTKPDVDVDFSITCSVPSKMNLTFKHSGKEGGKKEDIIITEKNCTIFKYKFSKSDYTFGSEENTTFYVYVYDFQSPLWIIISFSQHPKLDLLQFFITFSTCFLALLFIAAVLWKIKQKYDRYRRRQRLYVEMEQMASRPFGSVLVELERIPDTSDPNTSHARKRKKKFRPSPIALEPCAGNRAAVLSLIVRLPTGGHSYAPPGVPGIAVASSLVTLGNPRKQSTDQTQKVETETKCRKGRKVTSSSQATDL